jgi:hypothetical protein
MEELQQVRNRFPESPPAARALERTTALYRLHGGPRPAFALDPGFNVAAGDFLRDVQAIAVAPDGRLWIASAKTKSAAALDTAGKVTESLPSEQPRALSLSPHGGVVLAARTAVRIGSREIRTFAIPAKSAGKPPEPLERIVAAAITPGGSFLVSDGKEEKVFRYGPDGEYRGTFPEGDAGKREVIRILIDGEGGIVMLDRESRTVRVHDETGRAIRTVGSAGLRKPIDVAVDAFRNVYVADEEAGVQVFDAKGQPLTKIASPELKRPGALALDATGAVLVYDEGSRRLLRYR